MLYLLYAALFAALVSAATLPEEAAKPKHLKLDFDVLRGNSLSDALEGNEADLVKRTGQTELTLVNQQTFYAATLKLGTHGANNSVVVDTGSSDLWVMSSNVACSANSRRSIDDDFSVFSHRRVLDFEAEEMSHDAENEKRADTTTIVVATATATASSGGSSACTAAGSLNTADSASFKVNSSAPQFAISYADGTFARGFWGTDYIDFGSANVSDCSFAVVNQTSSRTGVFGIGFAGLETTYSGNTMTRQYTYENFPLRLKSTGIIHKVLYSLYLNTASASSGSVLFGAIDTAKFNGSLQTVPIINIYSRYYSNPIRFDIVLNSITLESSSQNVTVSSSSIPALLDSGTTLTYLPTAILNSLVSSLGATLTSSGYYRLSCSYNSRAAFAVFNFSGVRIKVPMSDLILSTGSSCYLGVMSQSADSLSGLPYAILGDNFLRNAYIVYNLEDYEISLAQVNYSDTENIQVVSSSVPSAVRAPGYSSTGVASSIASSSASSSLSPSGTRQSEGSNTRHYAKSLFLGVVGLGLVLCF